MGVMWVQALTGISSGLCCRPSWQTERNGLVSQLEDLGKRIDRMDALANKGLHHRIAEPDLHRLIVALLTVAYDLLTLAPPPRVAPGDPYSQAIEDFAKTVSTRGLT